MARESLNSGSSAAAFDNPEAYISRDRRRALAEGRELPDRVQGAALFADISGYTPVTEALAEELGSQRGSEELTANLNRVFHAVIEELDRVDGDVIYFSGDAITCWIDGDDGVRATACGFAMQEAIARVGEVRTPGGQTFELALKVAIAVGPARRFVVGDPEIQLIEVLAGQLIDALAAAEHLANEGEVVLEQSAFEALDGRVDVVERREDVESGRTAAVIRELTVPVPETPDVEAHHALPVELVRPWLLPAVYERLRTGRGEFLAELRPATPVFVRFTGIDYDTDDDAIEKLDEFIRRSQSVFEEHGGHLLQLTLGDKGAYLYGGLRLAAGARGRRRARRRRRARAARARRRDRRPGDPGRHRERPPAQRHLRPCAAPDVRLPRRRGEPRRPPHVARVAGAGAHDRGRAERGGRGVHLGAARRPHGQGQGGARGRVRAHGEVGDDERAACQVRAPDGRAARGARRARGRALARRGGAGIGRRDRGRRRRRQVASRGRVRSRRPRARRGRRLRRDRGVRREGELRHLAGDLADALPDRRGTTGGGAARDARARAGGGRSGARPARAAPGAGPRALHPGQRADQLARRRGPQVLARSPARGLPACSGRRGAARARPRGLPLDRPALARPAARPRACRCGAARGHRARVSARRRRAGRWARPRSARALQRASARSARSRGGRGADPGEADAGHRQADGCAAGARRARHGTCGGERVLPRGAPQLHRRPGDRRRRHGRAREGGAPREPAQPRPEPRRHAAARRRAARSRSRASSAARSTCRRSSVSTPSSARRARSAGSCAG